MSDLIGKTLGPYKILEKIGEGGMAVVYKGYQPALDRLVAIKVLRADLAGDAEFVTRFRREALAVARLSHPNILTVYDAGEMDGVYFMAMAYATGGSLKDLIRKKPLDPDQAVSLAIQLADALDYAHSQKLVHRDVKPSNILLDHGMRPMLADFGIVKVLRETTQLTSSGATIGTPEYMAPEQALTKPVDRRTDIYALGIVLYEMLAGRVPFSAETPVVTLFQQVNDPPPPLCRARAGVPRWLEAIVNRALVKTPQDRYQRAKEMADALRRGPEKIAVTPQPETQPREPARREARVPLILGAIAGLLVALAVGVPLLLSSLGGDAIPTISPTAEVAAIDRATPSPSSTPTRSGLVATAGSQAPSPSPSATRLPTFTPSASPPPKPTATVLQTVTAAPTGEATATGTATRAPTRTPTRTPTRRPPTSTPEPAASGQEYPAPILAGPADGAVFTSDQRVELSWRPVGQLADEEHYKITVAYAHQGQTWYDEVPWTRDTNWLLSEHRYLLDLCDDGRYRWSVQIVRRTGVDADGKPVGTPLSPASEERTLTWQLASDGGGGNGGGATTPAPTSKPTTKPSNTPPP
jgi:serine/threonine protein kinase